MEAEESVDIGTFTPPTNEYIQTYTVQAELDDETSTSLDVPVAGSSGTHSVIISITSEGELELYRAYM